MASQSNRGAVKRGTPEMQEAAQDTTPSVPCSVHALLVFSHSPSARMQ